MDGRALGAVVERAARHYRTPLAFPLMDLSLEKLDLLTFLGVSAPEIASYHFPAPPTEDTVRHVAAENARPFPPACAAAQGAVRYIAESTDLVPVGMLIGPFSLMTKLVADPITGVALAGSGVSGDEDASVLMVERALALASTAVLRAAQAQIEAGARALIVCEPAANTSYLSPRQIKAGSNVFERFVLAPNLQLRSLLASHDVDLIFHNCGVLTSDMVRQFATTLRPAMMSLGSSRKLWQDARHVPKNIVLFGNLPTKSFYSDEAMPADEVRRLTRELLTKMQACGHPHILGSECDVLYVPESAATILAKVELMLTVK
jgi:uroporphyrinogen-III decarboxylase